MAQYSLQSPVLTGCLGSGKTTIVTALADKLAANSIFVTCIQGITVEDIRRQVLAQLLPELIVHSEMSLSDILLKQKGLLAAHSHVIFDDAQFLPVEIWSECLEVTQLVPMKQKCSFTFVISSHFLSGVLYQLPPFQQKLLLPVEIDTLAEEEQSCLYYTLLTHSAQANKIPYEMADKQLCLQSATVGEVVNKFKADLHQQQADIEVKSRLFPNIAWQMLLIVSILGCFMLFLTPKAFKPMPQFTISASASKSNHAYADLLLAPYFEQRQAHAALATASFELSVVKDAYANQQQNELGNKSTELADKIDAVEVDNNAVKSITSLVEKNEQTLDDKFALLPNTGFVLQVASVQHVGSLTPIIEKLGVSEQLYIAKYQDWWVVLLGNFESAKDAHKEAERLQRNLSLPAPWVRRWADLSEFQLQQALPSS